LTSTEVTILFAKVKATSAGKQMNYAVAELTFGKFNVAY
jgi:hypothetical protein